MKKELKLVFTVLFFHRYKGHKVINPLEVVNEAFPEYCPKVPWQKAMKITILAMLLNADEVHLLPDWNDSRGAIIERNLALELKIPVIYP